MTTPQDHKQPKDHPQTVNVEGVKITVDSNIFDDLDVLEYIEDLQHVNDTDNGAGVFSIVPLLKKLCGSQYTAVKNALRDPETGRIPMSKVQELITTIMSEVSPN